MALLARCRCRNWTLLLSDKMHTLLMDRYLARLSPLCLPRLTTRSRCLPGETCLRSKPRLRRGRLSWNWESLQRLLLVYLRGLLSQRAVCLLVARLSELL